MKEGKNLDELYIKHNYLDITKNCLIGLPIKSYDMSSGGYSILKKAKVFSKKEIEYLDNVPKFERNYYIGNKIRKEKLSEVLMEGFIDARKRFMYYNDIIDDDILSIKKDAIFLINRPAKHLEFDGYKWKLEDSYSSYYYINNIEIYFSNMKKWIDIKGISNDVLELHREFFLDDLCEMFSLIESNNKNIRNRYIQNYRKSYITRDLDIGCYRELNTDSKFKYDKSIGGHSYYIDDIDDVNLVDIRYNYMKYLIPLYKMVL